MQMRSAVLALACAAAMWPPFAAHSGSAGPAPVAISIAADGRGLVLDAAGAIVELDTNHGTKGAVIYQAPPLYQAVNAAAASTGRAPTACISLYTQRRGAFNSWLLQVTDPRKPIWSWLPGRGYYGGCVLDEVKQRAYIASVSTGDVYALHLGVDVAAVRLVTLPNVEEVGPVAFSSKRRLLVVAETDDGTLFQLNVDTPKPTVLARITKGDIRAIAFDPTGDRLYAADSDTETIWIVEVRTPGAPPRRFSELSQFREPTGVAVDHRGRVWVADRRGRQVLRLAADGRKAEHTIDW